MFGLNDLHIAHLSVAGMGSSTAGHEKQDPGYVLQNRPDYVLASWEDYFAPVEQQFNALYTPEIVRSPTGPEVKWMHLVGSP